jgi:hypothetical protein
MKTNNFLKMCVMGLAACSLLSAWEDHPDVDMGGDRAFNEAQQETGAGDQGNDSYHKEDSGNDSSSSAAADSFFGIPDRDK